MSGKVWVLLEYRSDACTYNCNSIVKIFDDEYSALHEQYIMNLEKSEHDDYLHYHYEEWEINE